MDKEKLKKAIATGKVSDKQTLAVFVQNEELQQEIDTKIEKLNTKVDEALKAVKESELDLPKVLENVRGAKGEEGNQGIQGIQGEKGKDGIDGKDGKNGRDGKDGNRGDNGKDGINGLDGKDGKDGSPDTRLQIVEKINTGKKDDLKIEASQVVGFDKAKKDLDFALGVLDQRTQFLINKQSGSGSGTVGPGSTNEIAYFNSPTTVASLTAATYPSLTELSYVKGVTSAIQAQLDGKAASLTSDQNYVTDAQLVVIGNTSGANTGDQTSIVGITGTKAQFDTAVTDGNFLYVGDITQYTDEMAQDAVGAMIDATLTYTDSTPLLTVASAPLLTNARTIGGVSFNGSANITVASATGGFTISGGNLALGTNSITMTGSLGATGARLTKGWFTDLEVTNAIAGSITGNAATVTTNANLTGAITSTGNATILGTFTLAALNTAISDGNVPTNLTEFVSQTAWRVFYSDGSGDVIELALGADGTYLQATGASTAPIWSTPAGSGDVVKVGTPANNQVGVWTGDGTLEGDAALTFDTATNTLATELITATTVTAALTGDVTGNVSGTAATVTGAAQTAITSVGTLTVLQVDNININGNTISSTAGTDLLITPLAGQQLILDGTIEIDAGVVTGATSITSTAFVGDLTGNVTGNVSGTSATVTGATQAAITTLAGLVSVQGFTVTLADAGADAILGWDDSAAAYENLTQAEVLAVIGSSSVTAQGVVELATDAEAVTGTDTARAVTPANLTARMAAPGTIGGTTAAAITGTNITANTNFLPDANDGAGLGVSGTAFSDLFLASGALIDFAAGNAVITHSSGIITVSTGELRNTTAGTNTASVVTVGGTQTLTNKTLTSPTLTTPGAFTTGGNITLAENTGLVLDPVLSADGQYSASEMIIGTGGATIAFGDLVTLDKDDSRWELVDISVAAAATGDARGIIGIAVTSSTDGGAITVMLRGNIRADANFPALTIGAGVYASTTGDIVVAQPTTEDHVIRIIGFALTADSIYFCPENDWITHVT